MAIACSFPKNPAAQTWIWAFGYLLLRLLCAPWTPVPMAVPLDPAAVCLAGLLTCANPRSRPAALGILLISMALGDFFAGIPFFHLIFRCAGLLALVLFKPGELNGRAAAGYFLLHHALWTALPPELRGDFPLTYVYAATVLQGLLFYALLSPLLPKGERPRPRTLTAAALIPVMIFLLWVFFRPFQVWPPPTLGDTGGLWVRLFAIPLLFVPFVIPFMTTAGSRISRKSPRRKKKVISPTWRDLAD